MEKINIIEELKERVIGGKWTSIIGGVLAAIGAMGMSLQDNAEFSNAGKIMIQASAFLGHIVLLLLKKREDK